MQLSIIIVNYNVKYFLEQCLYSVRAASALLNVEVIVVDNNSSDGSVAYLKPSFPEVLFVEKGCNEGFAKGCNEGLLKAKGEYILFLNPDTIIAEDTLAICIQFFNQHTQAGALGIRMIDGRGRFLKESKRSFPSPLTSLFKLFGAATVFPRSKTFGRYHLGHLAEHCDHEIDVLAGAFMMIPKKVLQEVGTFDETFFMYGEDVDLSYRIQKKGHKNYYTAQSTIIHFKGESTKRGSLNYVRIFYSAMSIFVKKHYGGARGSLFRWAIQTAIWLRAFVAAFAKGVRWLSLPVIDAALILTSFILITELWTRFVKTGIQYPPGLLWIAFPSFTIAYLIVAYYAGLYNTHFRRKLLFRSTLIATAFLLAGYALLPEQFRFSRGILLFGVLTSFVLISVVRWLMVRAGWIKTTEQTAKPYLLIAGTALETESAVKLLQEAAFSDKIIGRVSPTAETKNAVTTVRDINKTVPVLEAKEIIFCMGSTAYKDVIEAVQEIHIPLRIRFHAAGSNSIVGSDSSGTTGDVIGTEAQFNLNDPGNRRLKRLIDGTFAFLFLITFPLHFFGVQKPGSFFKNCMHVLCGLKTWIGYSTPSPLLPPLRKSVISPTGNPVLQKETDGKENKKLIDYWYARNYRPGKDLATLLKAYKKLGS